MNRIKVTKIFQRFATQNPTPRTELNYQTPFELLIAVMLSAQATDRSVNQATAELFKHANTPETMLQLGELGLKEQIQAIGLANSKAKHIINTCQILIARHQATVPCHYEALIALPGVGRKTANIILNTVFGEPRIAVDRHIFRVSHRLGLATGKTMLQVENQLSVTVPAEFKQAAHHWLLLHGRYTCTARKPNCAACSIKDLCAYRLKM